ncbi:hypothetical protein C8R46DRAFT_1229618 [Mycena filopes]|nr:hypothetical protein C8R46DRAFT_1229618 [Mycena filopes]
MSTETVFPPELEREIFEITATMDRTSIPRLILVAHRVLTCDSFLSAPFFYANKLMQEFRIEPLLYRVVCVDQKSRSRKLVRSLLHKPPEFHNAVRHLLVPDRSFAKQGLEGLAFCPGITTFATLNCLADERHLAILEKMQVQHLILCVRALFAGSPVYLTHCAFSALTHLDMFDDVAFDHVLDLLPEIPVLPALTHLCLSPDIPRSNVLAVLAQCPRLHILLVAWFSFDARCATVLRGPQVYDVRFVTGA